MAKVIFDMSTHFTAWPWDLLWSTALILPFKFKCLCQLACHWHLHKLLLILHLAENSRQGLCICSAGSHVHFPLTSALNTSEGVLLKHGDNLVSIQRTEIIWYHLISTAYVCPCQKALHYIWNVKLQCEMYSTMKGHIHLSPCAPLQAMYPSPALTS